MVNGVALDAFTTNTPGVVFDTSSSFALKRTVNAFAPPRLRSPALASSSPPRNRAALESSAGTKYRPYANRLGDSRYTVWPFSAETIVVLHGDPPGSVMSHPLRS